MLRKIFFLQLISIMLFAFIAKSEERASIDEAKAMSENAVAFLKENGIEKSKIAFEAEGGQWHDRDLYVFVFSLDGVVQIHGANAGLIGRNIKTIRDVDGFKFVEAFLAVADKGWVDYKWQNPVNKKVEAKTSYIIRTGDMIVGVGAYK